MEIKYKGEWHKVTHVTKTPEGKSNVYWLESGSYVLSNMVEAVHTHN